MMAVAWLGMKLVMAARLRRLQSGVKLLRDLAMMMKS